MLLICSIFNNVHILLSIDMYKYIYICMYNKYIHILYTHLSCMYIYIYTYVYHTHANRVLYTKLSKVKQSVAPGWPELSPCRSVGAGRGGTSSDPGGTGCQGSVQGL